MHYKEYRAQGFGQSTERGGDIKEASSIVSPSTRIRPDQLPQFSTFEDGWVNGLGQLEDQMNDKEQENLDRAAKAMLGLGSVPTDEQAPEFTQDDTSRKFRTRVDRKGRGKMEEV